MGRVEDPVTEGSIFDLFLCELDCRAGTLLGLWPFGFTDGEVAVLRPGRGAGPVFRQGGGLVSPLPVGNGSGDNAVWAGQFVQFISRQSKYRHINSRLENFGNGHCETISMD